MINATIAPITIYHYFLIYSYDVHDYVPFYLLPLCLYA